MLGEFVTGDPVVRGGIGDSILEYRDDTTTNLQSGNSNGLYTAFFDRALYDDVASLSNPVAGINFGKAGGLVGLWLTGGAYLNPYLKYCNQFVDEFGTNTFNGNLANTPTLVATATADERSLWTQIRAGAAVTGGRAVKILRTKLLCRTTGAWAASDGSDQTVFGPPWSAGGYVEQFIAAMLADVGIAGRIDAYLDFDDIVRLGASGTPDFYKWKLNTTNDGVHPISVPQEAMAVKTRSALQALAA